MSQRKITLQRIIFLLDNWGCWESMERVGPMVSKVCGSAERAFVMNPRRHVWEGQAHVPRETPDEANIGLAEQNEQVLLRLDVRFQRVIMFRFARRLALEDIAERMRMSRVSALALLDSALVAVMSELENTSWASGL